MQRCRGLCSAAAGPITSHRASSSAFTHQLLADMEIIVLLDGIDESTSRAIEVRSQQLLPAAAAAARCCLLEQRRLLQCAKRLASAVLPVGVCPAACCGVLGCPWQASNDPSSTHQNHPQPICSCPSSVPVSLCRRGTRTCPPTSAGSTTLIRASSAGGRCTSHLRGNGQGIGQFPQPPAACVGQTRGLLFSARHVAVQLQLSCGLQPPS